MDAVIPVEVAPDPVRTGVWCGTCHAPSAVTWRVLLLLPDGVGDGGLITACPDCLP